MVKFYKALNFKANEITQSRDTSASRKIYFSRKLEYFENSKINFFLINVNKFQYFKVYFEKVSTKSAG